MCFICFITKIQTFFFYQFNQYLAQIGPPLKSIRHTVIAGDNYALTAIQEQSFFLMFEGKKLSSNRRWGKISSRMHTSRKCYSKRLDTGQ